MLSAELADAAATPAEKHLAAAVIVRAVEDLLAGPSDVSRSSRVDVAVEDARLFFLADRGRWREARELWCDAADVDAGRLVAAMRDRMASTNAGPLRAHTNYHRGAARLSAPAAAAVEHAACPPPPACGEGEERGASNSEATPVRLEWERASHCFPMIGRATLRRLSDGAALRDLVIYHSRAKDEGLWSRPHVAGVAEAVLAQHGASLREFILRALNHEGARPAEPEQQRELTPARLRSLANLRRGAA
jgi:hypothetical protein